MVTKDIVIVLGLLGQFPLAGIAWQLIHHLVGLRRLGFAAYYVEDTATAPYDPRVKSHVDDCSYSLQYIHKALARIGMEEAWAYRDGVRGRWYGMPPHRVKDLFAQARGAINLRGASNPAALTFRPRGKLIYLETDPVLQQVRIAEGDESARQFLAQHDVHITYGENLGEPDCPIPLPQFVWRKTRPPVVSDLWPLHADTRCRRFTTIATWHNRGKDLLFRGEAYHWSKHRNFLALADLPRCTGQELELAVEIDDPEELVTFRRQGWRLADPLSLSHDMDTYHRYIDAAREEFTVSKDVVVRTRSGWFSDRSVCFLAAGKPVVTQETGFSKYVPTGRGLFAFETEEEIVAAFDAINSDYMAHARAAHEIAEEYFDAVKLLGAMFRTVE